MKRVYFCQGVFAGKGWGKTTFLARRAAYEASLSSVSSVLIVDPPDSFRDVAKRAGWPRWTNYTDFLHGVSYRGSVPRVNVFCFGADRSDVAKYEPLFEFAVKLGDACLIVDEVQLFAPKSGKPHPALVKIAAMGRHLPNSWGEDRQTHLIVASQTWTGVNLEIRHQLLEVFAGRMAGRANHAMLEAEVHANAQSVLAELAPHEWAVLAPEGGRLPPLAPLSQIQ